MNSLPPGDRGAGGGMNQTFQNSAQVLSIGIFFTLMIIGLARRLPHAMATGLEAHGVAAAQAAHAAGAAAGLDPVRRVPGLQPDPAPRRSRTCSARCRPANHALLVGRSFFPQLISAPFRTGLHEAFAFAIVACLIAALASFFRGGLVRRRPRHARRVIRAHLHRIGGPRRRLAGSTAAAGRSLLASQPVGRITRRSGHARLLADSRRHRQEAEQ